MNKKIKVLHCIESMGSGGVEQLKLSAAKYIHDSEFEQEIICSQIRNDFDKRFAAYGIKTHPIGKLKTPFNLPYYWRLIRKVRSIRPDIIHGAVFEGVISAVIAGIVCRVPVIIIEETSEPLNRSWRGNLLLRLLSRFADTVLAISPSVKRYLIDVARIKASKVVLINYAVDRPDSPDPRDVSAVKRTLGIGNADFVVGSVGRLRDFHKRFSVLIKAMQAIKPLHPNIKLLIVGDGEDRQSLTSLAKSLDVEDKVIFAGYQSNTPLYYACMDVFALVSHMEAFGLVVVEAMFMKLPVLGTAVGGIKDIVVNNETGYLIEPRNVDAAAQALLKMYNEKDRLGMMGNAGYARAEKYFGVDLYAREIENLYHTQLQAKRAAGR